MTAAADCCPIKGTGGERSIKGTDAERPIKGNFAERPIKGTGAEPVARGSVRRTSADHATGQVRKLRSARRRKDIRSARVDRQKIAAIALNPGKDHHLCPARQPATPRVKAYRLQADRPGKRLVEPAL